VGKVLAFVIAGATSEELMAFNARLKRWGFPKLKGLGRLHIVMTIDDVMWLARPSFARSCGNDDGIALGWAQATLKS
jgi:hypothetical protein